MDFAKQKIITLKDLPNLPKVLGYSYATLEDIQILNDKVRAYKIKLITDSYSYFLPGQYINMQLLLGDNCIERSFTLTNFPYEIVVKHESNGLLSHWLFTHENSQPLIRVSQPKGKFILSFDNDNPIICLMAGIGVTPAIAYIRAILQNKTKRKFYLDYSAHGLESFIYKDLITTANKLENVACNLRDSKINGRININDVKKIINNYPSADIYLCGPKSFIASLLDMLNSLGISQDLIHVEKFTPSVEN